MLDSNLIIVKVDKHYCDYLRNYDYRVPFNKGKKELRPFIGILFKIHDIEYFAPLSSPKEKHKTMKNTLDFFRLKSGELGAINFNNMIPVLTNEYYLVDLNLNIEDVKEIKYRKMLLKQLNWLNENKIQIHKKSYILYDLYLSGNLPKNIVDRCCDFKLLEDKCKSYRKESKE